MKKLIFAFLLSILSFTAFSGGTIQSNHQIGDVLYACNGDIATYWVENDPYPDSIHFWTLGNNSVGLIVSGQNTNLLTVQWNNLLSPSTSIKCTINNISIIVSIKNKGIHDTPIIIGNDTTINSNIQYKVNEFMYNYKWSISDGSGTISGNDTNTVNITWTKVGQHLLTVSDTAYFCTVTASKIINISPSICMVSFDSINNKNKIIINSISDINYDKFRIYKLENNNFENIGELSTDSTTFIDNTSQPLITANTYKVSAYNSISSSESNKSPEHTTILLQFTNNDNYERNLNWNEYIGFDFDYYEIYRKIGNENWKELMTISKDSPRMAVDTTVIINQNVQYFVAIQPPCNQTKKINSNIKTSTLGSLGLNNILLNSIKIFPNPTSNFLNLKCNFVGEKKIEIADFNGRKIFEMLTNENTTTIDVSTYQKGIYFIKVISKENSLIDKFIKN